MKKIIWLAMLCIFGTLLLGGCGAQKSAGAKKIAVSFAESSESWHRNGLALHEKLEKDGFIVDLNYAKNAADQEQQVRRFVESAPTAIIIGAVDASALQGVLGEAKAKGIPVIAYDRLLTGTDSVSYYVSFDNVGIGEAQARSIEKALRLKEGGGSYNIELFAGDPADNNSHLFFAGAMKVLRPYIDSGKLTVPSGETAFSEVAVKDWNADNARARMEKLIAAHYADGRPLAAVLSPNDNVAGGIRDALESSYRGKLPLLTGQDADPPAVRAIADGRQASTIYKDPSLLVAQCEKVLRAIADGKAPDADGGAKTDNGRINVPSYLCKPVTVDKNNLEIVAQ